MKKTLLFSALCSLLSLPSSLSSMAHAQGWPADYGGVMLQGFYWDSYADSQWAYLESQASDIAPYFDLIWVPQSGYCGTGNSMGYLPLYYFRQNSSFGTEGQLRSLIETYRHMGTGFIADVVINHRNNLGEGGSWVDFATETYRGEDCTMHSTDIASNDDGGKTLTWANQHGCSLSSNTDTGEGWDGCRDLDHKSPNVNRIVKAYLDYLLNDLGYVGFRYDMVKGYSASYTADYNSSSHPAFSVGEYWDGSSAIKRWIDGTKVEGIPASGAFDFQFRYRVRDAFKQNNYATLMGNASDQAGYPLIHQNGYQQYAVTFVENHDTEYRSNTAPQDPFKGDTVAANAYMLSMPGTPCVFYKHWQTHKKELKLLISARKQAGITNTSTYEVLFSQAMYQAVRVHGTKGDLICVVGYAANGYQAPAGFTEIITGSKYRYFLADGALSGWNDIVARIEEEEKPVPFTPYDIDIYCKADFSPLYFYVWDSNSNTQLNGGWPGRQMASTDMVSIGGENWYHQSFHIPAANYYINVIFNQGSGKPQTTDISRINSTRYFVASLNGSSVLYEDVTSQHTGVNALPAADSSTEAPIYSLQGQRLLRPLPGQLYLQGGKKRILSHCN